MSLLVKKEFQYFDLAVIYITTCSDVDVSFKNSRRFLECRVMGTIPEINGEDKKYMVRCAEGLRSEQFKNGIFADQAIVSQYSPFLMTEDFFNTLKKDKEIRTQWLKEVEKLIRGENIPEGLEYWQNEVNMIIRELGITVDEAIEDIKSDFSDENMEIVELKRYC